MSRDPNIGAPSGETVCSQQLAFRPTASERDDAAKRAVELRVIRVENLANHAAGRRPTFWATVPLDSPRLVTSLG